jgi:tripartite-type tricarboxylate transporter receptor subunit TctC
MVRPCTANLYAPKATPKEAIRQFAQQLKSALKDPGS